jgi:hypothetical protein
VLYSYCRTIWTQALFADFLLFQMAIRRTMYDLVLKHLEAAQVPEAWRSTYDDHESRDAEQTAKEVQHNSNIFTSHGKIFQMAVLRDDGSLRRALQNANASGSEHSGDGGEAGGEGRKERAPEGEAESEAESEEEGEDAPEAIEGSARSDHAGHETEDEDEDGNETGTHMRV